MVGRIAGDGADGCACGTAGTSQADRIAALEKQNADNAAAIAAAQTAGDNAWMLVSAALVLMMSGPGLALFYGGLVRKKNILGTMMQTFAMMAVITVLWALVTYSLAFGEGNAFIGGLHNVFLHGVGLAPDPKYAATIPLQTFMVYQLMFAIITPALITGAFAERMKFSAMLVFMVLWALFVYSPMAHMVWGKGGLLNASLGGRFPTSGLCGRDGGACDFGGFGAGDGALSGEAAGVSEGADAAALGGAEFYRGLSAVGGLVWVQCGFGAELRGRWRRRRLWRRTLARRLRRLAGAWRSGFGRASLRRWERSRAAWPGWWRLRRRLDL